MIYKTIAILIILFIVAFIFWDNTRIKVTKYVISNKKINKNLDKFKIALITDLHNKDFKGDLIDKIKKESPDIIVVSGDFTDDRTYNPEYSKRIMNSFKAIAPVYYSTGNHEEREKQYFEIREDLINQGINILENESILYRKGRDRINIIGLRDPAAYTGRLSGNNIFGRYLDDRLNELNVKNDMFNILIAHRPEHIDVYSKYDIDLVLSGHVHGGQIRLPLIGAVLGPNQGIFPRYYEGVHKVGNTYMVVSRGLGNSAFPVRINNPPELVIIELRK